MRLISVEKDWKHVLTQKVVTLNTCCHTACLTFQLPHITTGSFQSHRRQLTTLQSLQRLKERNRRSRRRSMALSSKRGQCHVYSRRRRLSTGVLLARIAAARSARCGPLLQMLQRSVVGRSVRLLITTVSTARSTRRVSQAFVKSD